jgi:CBS domain-containing protein
MSVRTERGGERNYCDQETREETDVLVRDAMTSPALTVHPDTQLKSALVMLDEHAITMLPVVTASGEIVGVLSEADVVRDTVPTDVRTHLIPAPGVDLDRAPHSVADLMNQHPVTVVVTTDLATAAQLMTDTAVKSLPVLDEKGQVVGVLSRRDIVHILARTDKAVERDLDDLFRRVGTDWMVDVRDGTVTVSGPIQPRERALAEAAAMTVPGVRSVTVIPD